MNILLPIEISLIAGIFFLFLPEKLRAFTKVASPIIGIFNFAIAIIIFLPKGVAYQIPSYLSNYFFADLLSRFIYLGVGFFGFIISLYAVGYMTKNVNKFFAYFFLTLGSAFTVAIADNLIVLLVFWGILGITLYLLIQLGNEGANEAARKSLIIIGASDCFLILGIGILWYLTNSFKITEIRAYCNTPLHTHYSLLTTFSFICFVIAAFAKAGNMPLHSWIPPCAVSAPIPVTAYLPASLDKLLGIYLLSRCIISMYKISAGLSVLIMIFGAGTIIFAVFMALIQHSGKAMLGYSTVSQVGYMVLGIGTLNPIGICGGIFHMINNTIYKSCLFLGMGTVERNTGTDNLDNLGGLAGKMPSTFFSMLIASLAISGIPPLNGFFSKWMVYQGVINTLDTHNSFISVLCLIAALFGSALTLATFAKLIHSIFLTRDSSRIPHSTFHISHFLIVPQMVLAIACIVLGIFAYPLLINPVLKKISFFEVKGLWQPELATILIIAGIILGVIIYGVSRIKMRVAKEFIGGEEITPDKYQELIFI